MSVCDVARQYVALIQAGKYDEVGNLWTDDAVFENPHGDIIRGRAAITAFYADFLGRITPIVREARIAADEARGVCVLELETRMSRDAAGQWANDPDAPYSLSAIDRMEVTPDGRIKRMTVYLAPGSRWLEN